MAEGGKNGDSYMPYLWLSAILCCSLLLRFSALILLSKVKALGTGEVMGMPSTGRFGQVWRNLAVAVTAVRQAMPLFCSLWRFVLRG